MVLPEDIIEKRGRVRKPPWNSADNNAKRAIDFLPVSVLTKICVTMKKKGERELRERLDCEINRRRCQLSHSVGPWPRRCTIQFAVLCRAIVTEELAEKDRRIEEPKALNQSIRPTLFLPQRKRLRLFPFGRPRSIECTTTGASTKKLAEK